MTARPITLILVMLTALSTALALVTGEWIEALGWASAFFGWHTVYRMERLFK